MAESKTDLANQALLLLGADTIASLTEEKTEARAANLIVDRSIDYVLSLHPWKCAIKRVSIAPESTAPAFEFTAQFTLPSDLIRLLRIYNFDREAYRMEGNRLLCDESELSIIYIGRITNIPDIQVHVAEAIIHYMAYQMAYRLKPDLQDGMYKLFRETLSKSKQLDGFQNLWEKLEPDYLVDARLQGTRL